MEKAGGGKIPRQLVRFVSSGEGVGTEERIQRKNAGNRFRYHGGKSGYAIKKQAYFLICHMA